ncbi:DEAD/DEAH box helicase [Terricaulis silvestris]|uniref:N-formylmethionyl-tRNA deformylase n=1 Tax=Terricaulis silvestris TaxID=2686094 RepID=A0A6I6MT56_9CAUL|nr:C-terminal helicase domain-containing protein [Terricaulis silvestris]QGZ96626.1 N-formylmethionyl-tRNA deformylase [Terricaulis silvestris]
MPATQANAYAGIVRSALAAKIDKPAPGMMLQVLHALRGVSLHPVDPEVEPCDLAAYAAESARLKWTIEQLDRIALKREKVLIFVESLAMQERLAAIVQQRFKLQQRPHRIHGGVPGAKRQELVKAFQKTRDVFDVMILSPKAGGVGLTLTAANHVIHLSRWWNPAVEDQSTDRAYRIGQEKAVHVYLPLAEHPDPDLGPMSFDLRLHDLIEKKRTLSQQMLVAPEGDTGDIAALFEAISGGGPKNTSTTNEAPTVTGQVSDAARPIVPTPSERLVQRMSFGRWRLSPNEPRPLDEILAPFSGRRVIHLHILDPYAIADARVRRAHAQFVRELVNRGAVVEKVTISFFLRGA